MSDEKKINEEFEELDREFVEMVNKAENAEQLSKEEIEILLREAKKSLNFSKLVDDIQIPEDKYVVYTDGDVQLVYENGEFFLVSATDSSASRKKIKRKEAVDSYIEYFIKYQINPIIEKRKEAMLKKQKNQIQKTRGRKKVVSVEDIEKEEKKKIEEKDEAKNKKQEKDIEIER